MNIPEWLQREVDDYFAVALDFNPATVLDIGANIGAFAQRAHREWPEAKIICYEPMPFNLDLLRQNVSPVWCDVVPSAVRARAGQDRIFLGDMFVTGGFAKGERQTNRTIEVNCVAATHLPSCDVVKIDTEGCEVEIIENLNLSMTRAVLLEHHSKADGAKIKDILAKKFRIAHDESERAVGTMIFMRD